eukprot:3702143-Rhodomonas_salina.1
MGVPDTDQGAMSDAEYRRYLKQIDETLIYITREDLDSDYKTRPRETYGLFTPEQLARDAKFISVKLKSHAVMRYIVIN